MYKATDLLLKTVNLLRRKNGAKNLSKLPMYIRIGKIIASEYSNQLAYDSLQIHGGSGFMKDYPIERIYRDARITTITKVHRNYRW